MENDNSGINFSNLATIGVVSVFPALRGLIGIVCLLGLIGAGILWIQPQAAPVVNANPVCDRVIYQPQSAFLPPYAWGQYTKSQAAGNFYVREARGTGWCLVKHDDAMVIVPAHMPDGREVQMNAHRWYEVPSKYGQRVENLTPADPMASHRTWALILAAVSAGILVCIWLPATILAAVGRRMLRNVQE